MPETRTGGDLLVEALREGGVHTIFGLPGVQLDAAFDALARRSHELRLLHTRHEQGTSYMADGYARASGEVGCCLVVPGPGLLNALSGLATAYATSSRVVCVTGQVRSDLIDSDRGLLHEVPNQLGIARSVSKWVGRASRVEHIPDVMAEAFHQVRSGRPRPVVVEVPPDVLEAHWDGPVPPRRDQPGPPPLDAAAVDRAAGFLERSATPLIYAGGGVLTAGASPELTALAEKLHAPVVMTPNGKGAISARHPLAFEPPATARLLAQADVILAVATRFARASGTRWEIRPEQTLIRIDADPGELRREIDPQLTLEADARTALAAITQALPDRGHDRKWEGLDRLQEEVRAAVGAVQPQAAYGAAIRAVAADDTIVIPGMTQIGYWARLGFPVYEPRTFLGPGYQGTLGFELPTGLGAKVGRPDRQVLVIAGDGGFLFNVQELATAVQHGINTVTVVFDDGAYGNVRRIQGQRFGREIAAHLLNPDFAALAAAFGSLALKAEGPDELSSALETAFAADGPVLIHVLVGEMDDPWPLIRDGI